jgi:hypothetical protein
MFVALATFHTPIGWFNTVAISNMNDMAVTDDVSQF